MPRVKFLDVSELHVRIKSPIPESPVKVFASPPNASARRLISENPLVINADLALSPSFFPNTIPEAMAIIFFAAPPIWAPTTSWLWYILNSAELIVSAIIFPIS